MSEPSQKASGGVLKGALTGIGLCALGSVAGTIMFPLPLPDPTQTQTDPLEIAFDPPQVQDDAGSLVQPGQDATAQAASVDTDPSLPGEDRDAPVEANMATVSPETKPSETEVVLPPVDDIVEEMVAPVPQDDLDVAMSDVPDLGEQEDASVAPAVDIADRDALSLPDEVAMLDVVTPTPSKPVFSNELPAPDLGSSDVAETPEIDLPQDETLVAISASDPTKVVTDDAPSELSVNAPIVEASPGPKAVEPAPLTELPEAPKETGQRLASAVPTPAAVNPVTQKTEAVQPQASAPPDPDIPAFIAHANDTFAPQGGKPFLTVIIEDVGQEGVPLASLVELDPSFTIALTRGNNSSDAYRANRFELVALIADQNGAPLSGRMTGDQLRTHLDAIRSEFGQTVALLEAFDGNMYRSAGLMSAMAQELVNSGHGVLVFERFGASAAVAAVRSEGVPNGSVLRVLDNNRDPIAIRRALDRAALEASKTGTAIVYARSYPETLAALVPWLLSNTARSVQIAPLTATIKRAEEG